MESEKFKLGRPRRTEVRFRSESTGLSRIAEWWSHLKASRLKTQEEPTFQSEVQMLEMMNVLAQAVRQANSFSLAFCSVPGLQLTGLEAPIMEKAVCFTPSTYSKVDLIQDTLLDISRIMFNQMSGQPWCSRVDT